MRVRRYMETDRALCLAVFDSNVPGEFTAGERGEYAAFLADLPGPYWVVEERWEIIGCGGVAREGDGETAALCWGMVRRDRQGEGWGRYLLRARLAWIEREGWARRVVVRTSDRARGFFERHGFDVRHVEPDGLGPGLDRVDMTLELPDGPGGQDAGA